ncbi:hypothetical protein H5410_005407 [Solanum commersonii]|uniref:Uncharacterized protein n=1 Tax=Solanum commersonii TaxID=4109 RepID=A0A9J6A6J3_SOLCO|nr:hypothetical protein H5410_005407 [Solanum commersonii]
MIDSGASDQNGRGPIPYDEHIADLMQKMANMHSEIDRLRNLTNLSITLNTPLPEHGTITITPPHFPSVDSFVLNSFHQILPFTRLIQLLSNNPPTLNNLIFHKTIHNKPTLYHSLLHMHPKLCLPKLQSSKLTH